MICKINQTSTNGWDYASIILLKKIYSVEFSSSKIPIMTLF